MSGLPMYSPRDLVLLGFVACFADRLSSFEVCPFRAGVRDMNSGMLVEKTESVRGLGRRVRRVPGVSLGVWGWALRAYGP